MLSKNEKNIIRNMVRIIILCHNAGLQVSAAVIVADSYVSSLCLDERKLSFKSYKKYRNIINKLNSNSIISFKGW